MKLCAANRRFSGWTVLPAGWAVHAPCDPLLFCLLFAIQDRLNGFTWREKKGGERAIAASRSPQSDRPHYKFVAKAVQLGPLKWVKPVSFPPFYTKLFMKFGSSSAILDHHHCLIIHSLLQLLRHRRSIHSSLSFCYAKQVSYGIVPMTICCCCRCVFHWVYSVITCCERFLKLYGVIPISCQIFFWETRVFRFYSVLNEMVPSLSAVVLYHI